MVFINQLITGGHHPVVIYKKRASSVESVGAGFAMFPSTSDWIARRPTVVAGGT
jgi:hypothetical protein